MLTPETMGHLEKVAPEAFASGDGVKLTAELEKQGYDGLIVRGFDKLDEASLASKREAGRLFDEGKITADEYEARHGAADQNSEYWKTLERGHMNHEWAQDQIVSFKPETQLETRRAAPAGEFKFATDATPSEKMQALSRDVDTLSLQNRGVSPDEFLNPNLFADMARGQDAATVALAQGMDTAKSIGGYFVNLGRELLADESGALTLFRTPAQKLERAQKGDARDFVQPLLIKGMGAVARAMDEYGAKFDYYRDINGKTVNLHKLLNPHMPEWREEIAKGPMGNPMATKVGDMIKYVEGRSNGYTMQPDNPLAPLADTIREVNLSLRARMEQAQQDGLHNLTSYYNDYFRHLWKDPLAADREFGIARQGSAASFQLRSIPTIEDGIARGLVPKIEHPIELVMYDAAEKTRYLQQLYLLDEARNTKSILTQEPFAYWGHSAKPGSGDKALQGVGVTKDVATPPTVGAQKALVQARAVRDALNAQVKAAGGVNNVKPSVLAQQSAARAAVKVAEEAAKPKVFKQQMWANPGFANHWNETIAKGFFSRDFTGKMFEQLNYAKNLSTQGQLIGPFFHARTMAMETVAGGFANIVSELIGSGRAAVQGRFGAALTELTHAGVDFAKTATILPKIGEQLFRGDKGLKIYQGRASDPALNPIVDILTNAGARFGKRQDMYRLGSAPTLMESLRRGSLGEEYRAQWDYLRGDKNAPYAVLPGIGRMFGFVGHEIGRVLNTTTGPLFDFVIPRLKVAVNIERMQTYIRQNPTATQDQLAVYARKLVNNTDDRMGEMNMNNIFWPRAVKQAAQLSMISPGWVYGSARFFTNAVGMNMEKGKFIPFSEFNEPATTSLVGFAMAYSLFNSLSHLAYNGEMPQDWRDVVIGPLTGAVINGVKQRLMQPSQAKEIFDYGKIVATGMFDPMKVPEALKDYALGKMPGLWQLMRGLLSGKDAIGHDIGATAGGWPGFLLKTLTPMVIGNSSQRKQGSEINRIDEFLGAREAPKFAEDPEGFYKGLQYAADKAQKEEHYRAIAENKIYEEQRDVPDLPESMQRGGGRGRSRVNPDELAARKVTNQRSYRSDDAVANERLFNTYGARTPSRGTRSTRGVTSVPRRVAPKALPPRRAVTRRTR